MDNTLQQINGLRNLISSSQTEYETAIQEGKKFSELKEIFFKLKRQKILFGILLSVYNKKRRD